MASMISDVKSAANLIEGILYKWWIASPLLFPRFFLCPWVLTFEYSVALCIFLRVSFLEFSELHDCVDSCILPNLGTIWPLLIQIFLLPLPFSPLHLGSPLHVCWYASLCPKVLLGSVHLCPHSQIVSSACSHL